ncbi:MAG: hypothetical protein NTW95_12115 [Candidatus Aminicenantes bacterium]|nr:hypothetical protein [Candidatus Aminicenantes bacterium]
MRKKSVIFLGLAMIFSLRAVDWKKETAARIAVEKNYPQLVESLQKVFPDLAADDKAVVCLLIGYCQSRLNNPPAELSWMKKYLEQFKAADVKIGFIAVATRQKILQFKASWQRDFPVIRELAMAPASAAIAYFSPPSELKLRLQLSVPCQFQLFAANGDVLAQGVLGEEPRVVAFPVAGDFFRTARHDFRLLLTLVGAPEKEMEKYFAIEMGYQAPENTAFDPLTAELKIKGREFQPEARSETVILSQRTVFDKQEFKKSFLKDLLIGAGFFIVNATFVSSTISNPETSLYAKSALYGMHRVFNIAGIAFSLKALLQLPKVIKREKVTEEKTVALLEAKAANEGLKQELVQAKEKVMVQLSVKPGDEEGGTHE